MPSSLSWLSVCEESLRDAERLLSFGGHRSVVNRSYYCGYYAVHAIAENVGVSVDFGPWIPNNWPHAHAAHVLFQSMAKLQFAMFERKRLNTIWGELLSQRRIADYLPDEVVDDRFARTSLSHAKSLSAVARKVTT